jgi:hypothetical protein
MIFLININIEDRIFFDKKDGKKSLNGLFVEKIWNRVNLFQTPEGFHQY